VTHIVNYIGFLSILFPRNNPTVKFDAPHINSNDSPQPGAYKMGAVVNASLSVLYTNSYFLEKWNGIFLARS